MITCFFGVPGVGKTSLLAKIGIKELKLLKKGKSPYDHIYTNFFCEGLEKIDFSDLSKYRITNSLLLFDELTLDADNREFRKFPLETRDFLTLHRHEGCDIIYATQNYANVDSKVRDLTQDLWYMSRSVVPFFRRFTTAKKIYRCIVINEHTGDLILGYRFCNFLEALFASNKKICYRPRYYKYFDSYDPMMLANRPVFESSEWKTSEPRKDCKKNHSWLSCTLSSLLGQKVLLTIIPGTVIKATDKQPKFISQEYIEDLQTEVRGQLVRKVLNDEHIKKEAAASDPGKDELDQ